MLPAWRRSRGRNAGVCSLSPREIFFKCVAAQVFVVLSVVQRPGHRTGCVHTGAIDNYRRRGSRNFRWGLAPDAATASRHLGDDPSDAFRLPRWTARTVFSLLTFDCLCTSEIETNLASPFQHIFFSNNLLISCIHLNNSATIVF